MVSQNPYPRCPADGRSTVSRLLELRSKMSIALEQYAAELSPGMQVDRAAGVLHGGGPFSAAAVVE